MVYEKEISISLRQSLQQGSSTIYRSQYLIAVPSCAHNLREGQVDDLMEKDKEQFAEYTIRYNPFHPIEHHGIY